MRGSHRQFRHAAKPGIITVAGNDNIEIPQEYTRHFPMCSVGTRNYGAPAIYVFGRKKISEKTVLMMVSILVLN